jgi:indolepyruvate ferredoxin oxidoreductase beta subunit
MKTGNQEFNMIINGIGGQGLITLLKIISEAALIEGKDVRTSELHGLSQRGGSVEVYIRFGKKVWSPLVEKGKADLILSLEMQEAINGLYFSSKNTVFLINKYQTPTFLKDFSEKEVLDSIKKLSQKAYLISAGEICQKEFGTDVVTGIYLLGYAVFKGFLPLKPDSLISAIKKIVPERFLELNEKALNLAKN